MSMRDPEDRELTHRIAFEQQKVLNAATQMNRGTLQGIGSDIPVVSTFPPQASGQYRYIVIVKLKDLVSGATKETMVELYSDSPIPGEDIKKEAIIQVLLGQTQDTITGALGTEVNWGEQRASIISVSKRA